MTDQPPNRPSNEPTNPPNNPSTNQAGGGNPPTQPMFAAQGAPPVGPPPASTAPDAPRRNMWQQATSTNRRRWGLGIGAGALAVLMLLGVGFAGLAVLRNHDRISLVGDRRDGFSRGDDRPGMGDGGGPQANERRERRALPGMPGLPGGRANGPGGLGSIGGMALHGQMTAPVNGSVQALLFQRGEVTAVSATSITLKSSDGFTGTYGLTSATTSRRAAAVKGGQAFVLARASDKVAIRTMAKPARVGTAPSS
jgi:hypothetical protein